jgi:voltage-gated potassium channel
MKAVRVLQRSLQASTRDTFLLLNQFKNPLVAFIVTQTAGSLSYFFLSRQTSDPVRSIAESFYHILTLTFLQSTRSFPGEWYLDIFYFIMPILGLGILAQGLADFSIMLFNRRARGKEWEMAVASTFSDHVVLVGLGHLGYRVVVQLININEDVVVIEQNPQAHLLENIRQMNIPFIQDDGTREVTLISAGIQKAKTIILCTQNDAMNLQMATKARSLNPKIQVIIRIFDDDFAHLLEEQFNFRAFSATGMAAPIFAACAANIEITPPISIEGQPHSLVRLEISKKSALNNINVDTIENKYHISVILVINDGRQVFHPQGDLELHSGDTMAFLAQTEQIQQIIRLNRA